MRTFFHYGTVDYGTLWYVVYVWYIVVHCGTLWYIVVHCGTLWCIVVLPTLVQGYNGTQWYTLQIFDGTRWVRYHRRDGSGTTVAQGSTSGTRVTTVVPRWYLLCG